MDLVDHLVVNKNTTTTTINSLGSSQFSSQKVCDPSLGIGRC